LLGELDGAVDDPVGARAAVDDLDVPFAVGALAGGGDRRGTGPGGRRARSTRGRARARRWSIRARHFSMAMTISPASLVSGQSPTPSRSTANPRALIAPCSFSM
jgi:hypothetical protein